MQGKSPMETLAAAFLVTFSHIFNRARLMNFVRFDPTLTAPFYLWCYYVKNQIDQNFFGLDDKPLNILDKPILEALAMNSSCLKDLAHQ
jgi:hypothetical protein